MAPSKHRRGGKALETVQHGRGIEESLWYSKFLILHREVTPELHVETIEDETENGSFIPEDSLQKIWTHSRIKTLLEITDIINHHSNSEIVNEAVAFAIRHFKKIVSVLFDIVWTEWPSFKKIFWDLRDKNGKPIRSDGKLPFSRGELETNNFLQRVFGRKFEEQQFKFIPVCIKSDPHNILEAGLRLPWHQKKKIGSGASGAVFKALVARQQFEYIDPGKPLNDNELPVAIKSFKFEDSFEEEVKNLSTIRDALLAPKHILSFLATISLGNQCHILSHLAEMDLEKFLTTPTTDFKISMPNLIAESSYVADALDFLHTRITIPQAGGQSQHQACCHMDLKPDNILVFRDPKHPVGLWRITDFGISTIRDRPLPSPHKGKGRLGVPTTVGMMITSSIKTNAKRGPGTYQAPEVNYNDGLKNISEKSDIYSFGCILTRIFAFGLGHRQELIVFDKGRRDEASGAGDDYFYCKTTSGPPCVINPYVKKFLDNLPGYYSMRNSATEYLDCRKAKDILLRMLNPNNPRSRPEASEVYIELNSILPSNAKTNLAMVHARSRSNSSASVVMGASSSSSSSPRPSRLPNVYENFVAHAGPSSHSLKPPNLNTHLATNLSNQPHALMEEEDNPRLYVQVPGSPQPHHVEPVSLPGSSQKVLPTSGSEAYLSHHPTGQNPRSVHMPSPPLTPQLETPPGELKHLVLPHPKPRLPSPNTRSANSITKLTDVNYGLDAPKSPESVFISASGSRLVLMSENQVYIHYVDNKSIAYKIPQLIDEGIQEMNWTDARVVDDCLFLKGKAKKPKPFYFMSYPNHLKHLRFIKIGLNADGKVSSLGKVAYVYESGIKLDKKDSENLLIKGPNGLEKIEGDIFRVWYGTSGAWFFAWTTAKSEQIVYIWDAQNPVSAGLPFKHQFQDSDKVIAPVKGIISFPTSPAYIFWERDDFLSIIRSPDDIDHVKRTKVSGLKAVVVAPAEDMVVLVKNKYVSIARLGSRVGDWDKSREYKLAPAFEETMKRSVIAVKSENGDHGGFTVVIGHKNGKVQEIRFATMTSTAS